MNIAECFLSCFICLVFIFMLASCEGPTGPQGDMGDMGDNGDTDASVCGLGLRVLLFVLCRLASDFLIQNLSDFFGFFLFGCLCFFFFREFRELI